MFLHVRSHLFDASRELDPAAAARALVCRVRGTSCCGLPKEPPGRIAAGSDRLCAAWDERFGGSVLPLRRRAYCCLDLDLVWRGARSSRGSNRGDLARQWAGRRHTAVWGGLPLGGLQRSLTAAVHSSTGRIPRVALRTSATVCFDVVGGCLAVRQVSRHHLSRQQGSLSASRQRSGFTRLFGKEPAAGLLTTPHHHTCHSLLPRHLSTVSRWCCHLRLTPIRHSIAYAAPDSRLARDITPFPNLPSTSGTPPRRPGLNLTDSKQQTSGGQSRPQRSPAATLKTHSLTDSSRQANGCWPVGLQSTSCSGLRIVRPPIADGSERWEEVCRGWLSWRPLDGQTGYHSLATLVRHTHPCRSCVGGRTGPWHGTTFGPCGLLWTDDERQPRWRCPGLCRGEWGRPGRGRQW